MADEQEVLPGLPLEELATPVLRVFRDHAKADRLQYSGFTRTQLAEECVNAILPILRRSMEIAELRGQLKSIRWAIANHGVAIGGITHFAASNDPEIRRVLEWIQERTLALQGERARIANELAALEAQMKEQTK